MRWISILTATLMIALAQPAAAQLADVETLMADRVLGDPNAPVTIISYESFTCPHCAAFHADNFAGLKERYIDTGQVKMIFRDFPLDAVAVRAHMLARCTAEPRFYGMVDVLFRKQQDWRSDHDVVGALGQIGRLAGVNDDAFNDCMSNEALLNAIVQARQDASNKGVNSTPTFEINGTLYPGNRTVEEFAQIIDPLLPSN